VSRQRIIGFCGSSWRPARSRALGGAVGADLRERHAITIEIRDLVDAGPGLAAFSRDGLSGSARAVIEAIENADGLVIGCVFQGSYPGLFKHVFDLIDPGALKNRPGAADRVGRRPSSFAGGRASAAAAVRLLRSLHGFQRDLCQRYGIRSRSTAAADHSRAAHRRSVDQFAGLLKARCADAA
jgi:FMN reductase